MKDLRWINLADYKTSESGSAVVLTLVVLVALSIPLTMMLGWSEEFKEINRNYRIPKLEIRQNISTLVACSDTLSAIPSSNDCSSEVVVNGLDSSKAIVVDTKGLDIVSLEGKTLAVVRLVCKKGRVLFIQMAKPDNKTLKFFEIGKLRCAR